MGMVEVLLAAVVILQIVTIGLIRGNKRYKRGNSEFRHPRSFGGDNKTERKEGDFRRGGSNNRKFPQENRNSRPQTSSPAPQQQSSQVTIDPVEKSLRDINLKLKNAEREQESARKKIQGDYTAKEGRPQQRQERQERSGYNGNNGGKRNNRDHRRDSNREPRRDNWQERQNRGDSEQQAVESENEKQLMQQPAVQEPVIQEPVNAPEQTADIISNDSGASEGEFEHGRKFVAKRRQLQENGADAAESDSSSTSESSQEPQADQQSEETEMKFGRR